ncbi:MAG: dockerin type I repeat-containing protein [Candidatus Aenigmarchaeota archaeon]|nr:dockerin type I repeat-containing protein [Candidatus Aenigmarchaeota archaeon]
MDGIKMTKSSPIPLALLLVVTLVLLFAPTNVKAATEICDGIDNDGDGYIDEYNDPVYEESRYVGQGCYGIGTCGFGKVECENFTNEVDCWTNPGGSHDNSSVEICDTFDNDCDGSTDEEFYYDDPVYEESRYVGQGCYGIGTCGFGKVECFNVNTASCWSNPGGTRDNSASETCNALDDDCDGLSDEDFTYQGLNINQTCDGIGKCGLGLVECSGTSTADCSTNPGASADESVDEVCDGNDSDCNGVIDDDGDALCLLPESGLWCEGHDGECMGPDGCFFQPFDCTNNDIEPISICSYTPDGYDWTLDVFTGFVSACDEENDVCTTGTVSITSTCNVSQCGAECDSQNPCSDKCVGDVYNYGGSCESDCSCFYLTEDCNASDVWYDTGEIQWVSTGECTEKEQKEEEYRDYICGGSGCEYSVTDTQWVDTGTSSNKDDGTPCDDGNFCTVNDVCQSGECSCESRDCSDGVGCTVDSCDEETDSCENSVNNALCDDTLFCNGNEFCDALLDCQAGTPPVVDDGVTCTDDSCDEINDVIVNTPNNGNCDNELWCDGSETCDALLDCQAGIAVDCSANNILSIATCTNDPDSIAFTWDWFPGFTSSCDEANDVCTTGTVTLTHTCDIIQCGAECESDGDCNIDDYCYGSCECKPKGDANGDDIVDVKDLVIVAKSMKSCASDYIVGGSCDCLPQRQDKWNPLADLNKDGVICIDDLSLVGRNFGKS